MENERSIFNVPISLIVRHHNDGSELPPYRTEFMRDRDRLMYATAFRRLAGKTQIFTVGADDHKKNRLTHTLEVAQIARTIAAALGLNPDLAEAIALAHDFGHTPFGHAGEQILHEIMIPNSSIITNSPFYKSSFRTIERRFQKECPRESEYLKTAFGFKHNLQSVRVTALLEDSYRGRNDENIGLNLTNYTLCGMMLHSNLKYNKEDVYPNLQQMFYDRMTVPGSDTLAWSFEAYIVKWADDIAQWHHDLEDAMREGVLPMDSICKTIRSALGEKLLAEDEVKLGEVCKAKRMDRRRIAELSHIVVNTLVCNLIDESKKNFARLEEVTKRLGITNVEILFRGYDALNLPIEKEKIIDISNTIHFEEFRDTIKGAVHHSRNVERMNEKGKYIIRKLFEAYYAHPQQLPDGYILHLLTEVTEDEQFKKIDNAKDEGIGRARVEFERIMKNPNVYVQCILMRRICDHIASMTDHYAIEEYNNLYG